MFILDKIGMGLTMRMAETADTEITYNINYTVLDINEENMGRSSIQGIMDIEYMEPLELTPCLLYTSPSPRDRQKSRMPSSA